MTLMKKFDEWNALAKELETLKSRLLDQKTKKYLFHPREIWYCSIGVNIGVEICGKNQEFERPVLILKKSGRQFNCLPLTSKRPKNSDFYFDISYIDPSNGKEINSYVIITTPLTCDVNRLQRKVKKLDFMMFQAVITKTQSYLFPNF
jgi:mRNA interferase MazF